MDVKWGSLGEVASVSIGATVGVVLLFTLGYARWASGRRCGRPAATAPRTT